MSSSYKKEDVIIKIVWILNSEQGEILREKQSRIVTCAELGLEAIKRENVSTEAYDVLLRIKELAEDMEDILSGE